MAGAPVLKRLAYGLAAFALPTLVNLRVVSTGWRKGSHRAELLRRSLRLLVLFASAWGVGEIVGLLGRGGQSAVEGLWIVFTEASRRLLGLRDPFADR